MKSMPLNRTGDTRARAVDLGVGMYVHSTVGPGPAPAGIVQKYAVPTPIEADRSRSPAPGSEEAADGDAEAETDRAANGESDARGEEHDPRIIVGNHDKGGIHRQDGDVRPAAYQHL